jgi:nicotinamide-nucleotide amidase
MPDRPLRIAALLSVGTELTTGGTRDTNAGDLARDLSEAGVWVASMTALPDDLDAVRRAFESAMAEADLVVSTGGLGPTPDDLTREAIAAAVGETPTVDPELEQWLRGLWARRRVPFPEVNLKQAWLIPSSTALANERGTAPGWWVDRPDGRVVVSLPGPPREMLPMWRDGVLPRLRARGLGVARATRVLRTVGIGESALAERLGDLLRGANPSVATYARIDGVDIRVSATDEVPAPTVADAPSARSAAIGRSADRLADDAVAELRRLVGEHVWGVDGDTWPGVIDAELQRGRWRVAVEEIGTAGAFAALLGGVPGIVRTTALAAVEPDGARRRSDGDADRPDSLFARAGRARSEAGVEIGLAIAGTSAREDSRIDVAVVGPGDEQTHERRPIFLRGEVARERTAAAAASVLLSHLRAMGR